MVERPEEYRPTIAELETTCDRLAGRGISGLIADDWPVLRAALEDYIAIRRDVEKWPEYIQRAVDAAAQR